MPICLQARLDQGKKHWRSGWPCAFFVNSRKLVSRMEPAASVSEFFLAIILMW